jgi:ADP-ribose pyrophosphatase YjhB (NUDIX family)
MNLLRKNKHLGTLLFYLLWPLVWFYAPLRVRVRVIIKVGDEVLIVRNWFGPNIDQLPGGGMKFGESLIESASREISEETGVFLDSSLLKLLSENVQIVRIQGLLLRYKYVLAVLSEKPNIKPSLEITKYKWITKKDLNIPPNVKSAL